jgi:predicted  nucleic acid-binding Zn-ribbon protein
VKFLDNLTGKNVEAKVEEFSEVYGEIVVGLHREFETLKSNVQRLVNEFNLKTETVVEVKAHVDRMLLEVREDSEEIRKVKQELINEREKMHLLLIESEKQMAAFTKRVSNCEAEVHSMGDTLSGLSGQLSVAVDDVIRLHSRLPSIEDKISGVEITLLEKINHQNKRMKQMNIVLVAALILGMGGVIWKIVR